MPIITIAAGLNNRSLKLTGVATAIGGTSVRRELVGEEGVGSRAITGTGWGVSERIKGLGED